MSPERDISEVINRPGMFSTENGITVTQLGPDRGEGELQVRSTSLNPHGIVHGGCLYTLADTVAGSAAIAQSGKRCVTVNGTLEFLRPAVGSLIRCVATPKKLGRTLAVMQVELTDDKGKLVATGTFTFFLFEGELG